MNGRGEATNPARRWFRRTKVTRPRSVRSNQIAESPARKPSCEELLARVARGDRQAFSALYDEVAPAVYGVASRVLRDRSQSEEVAQEVMVEIWRTAGRFSVDRGSARTWCSTIAHRRSVDRVRSEEAARRRDDRAGRLDLDGALGVEGEVIDLLERERVGQALDRLTELQRQAVELAFYEGRTHHEVAALLDVPLGTVKTRIRDGLIRLRDTMEVTP